MYFFTSRTHSFDDSNPRLARKGKSKKTLSNSTRRVSWHSGLDLVDGLGVIGAMRTGNSPLEVSWEKLIYINKLSKSQNSV